MRRSNGAMIIKSEGVPIAINLGADFVSEHEHGIAGIYRDFGVDVGMIGREPPGIESRMVKKVPDWLGYQDYSHKPKKAPKVNYDDVGYVGTMLYLVDHWRAERGVNPKEMREISEFPLYIREKDENGRNVGPETTDFEPLSAAWSDRDFAVFARKKEDIHFLDDLHSAFQNKDVAIWLGKTMPDNPFENAGLVLGIVSRMPTRAVLSFLESDRELASLEQMDAATGIKDRLARARAKADSSGRLYPAPFSYYALSPRLIGDRQFEGETAHPIIYWLNPTDQQNNNFGWFTVEQLDQWIAGEGPIPGKKKPG